MTGSQNSSQRADPLSYCQQWQDIHGMLNLLMVRHCHCLVLFQDTAADLESSLQKMSGAAGSRALGSWDVFLEAQNIAVQTVNIDFHYCSHNLVLTGS